MKPKAFQINNALLIQALRLRAAEKAKLSSRSLLRKLFEKAKENRNLSKSSLGCGEKQNA